MNCVSTADAVVAHLAIVARGARTNRRELGARAIGDAGVPVIDPDSLFRMPRPDGCLALFGGAEMPGTVVSDARVPSMAMNTHFMVCSFHFACGFQTANSPRFDGWYLIRVWSVIRYRNAHEPITGAHKSNSLAAPKLSWWSGKHSIRRRPQCFPSWCRRCRPLRYSGGRLQES